MGLGAACVNSAPSFGLAEIRGTIHNLGNLPWAGVCTQCQELLVADIEVSLSLSGSTRRDFMNLQLA